MRRTLIALAVLCALACLPAIAEEKKAEDGKSLFSSKCAMCHGADGVAKPMAKGSSNFNDPAFQLSADEIAKITLEGKGKMPKFEGKLTAEQAKAVAEYVKGLAPKK